MRKWQRLLDECCRSVEELQGMLGLDADEMEKLHGIEEKYPVCVPEYYLGLIDPADRQDPDGILRRRECRYKRGRG